MKLCAEKTKLLKINKKTEENFVPINPITINGENIEFSDTAVHVGVVRTDGNLPHILDRITAHKKAMGAVMFTGLARPQTQS